MKLFHLGLMAAGGLLALACSDDNSATSGSGGTGGHAGSSGGLAGLGGSGPGGGGGAVSVLPPASFVFTDSTDGFALDTFANSGPFTDGNPQNIGGVPNGATMPVVSFDAHEGMPDDGSVKITATFNDFNQTITVRRVYQPNQTIDLTGKTVTAQIKLDGGGSFTGIVHLMALSSPSPPNPAPGYLFAQGDSIRLTDGDWHTLRFQMASPEFAATGFAPNDIVQLGVQLASGLAASTSGAAGAGGGTGGTGAAGAAGGTAGSGTAGAGGGTASAAPVSAYGSPQSITIHFDTMSWN